MKNVDSLNMQDGKMHKYLNPGCNHNLMDIVDEDFEISRGSPLPLGATIKQNGVNFAIFSKHASAVSLVLFMPGKEKPIVEFPLDQRFNRTGDIWHAFIRGLSPDIEYGYRVDGIANEVENIHRFDSSKILLDPYAKAISGRENWGEVDIRNGTSIHNKQLRSLIIDDQFDWGFDQPLNIPLSDTIIYELHVRGFTKHDSSHVKYPGTYMGLIEKIPYLKELGITAVELLPINEFSEIDANMVNPQNGERLLNYWGYNSLNFFSTKASYASNAKSGNQVNEFKYMVKTLHEAGLEVILDVVFNHTAEGNEHGCTYSFRGLDNSIYYLINPQSGEYLNYSGCGNTLNCNHPVVRDMVLDSLRYWVTEMHVDGFRFDLASILGRGRDGSVLANPPLLERIAADPILGNTKLIAEAWDAAGLYQVGSFPSWERWAEWNAKFRDDIRKFVKSDPGMVPALASRLAGSLDVYAASKRSSYHSINFITCHDGFTLADLVSYNDKHNEANGENNRDGANDNNSWNCGFEGLTGFKENISDFDYSIEKVESLRRRQIKNMASILLLSKGVPMILAGDEFGRSQQGNNNAYCQDNEISWFNWDIIKENADLFRFFKLLMQFRKNHPALRYDSTANIKGKPGFPIIWHGVIPFKPDWSYESRCLAMQIQEKSADNCQDITDIYIAANSHWEPHKFILPVLTDNRKWRRKADTILKYPWDISEENKEPVLKSQKIYKVGPRTVVVLIGK